MTAPLTIHDKINISHSDVLDTSNIFNSYQVIESNEDKISRQKAEEAFAKANEDYFTFKYENQSLKYNLQVAWTDLKKTQAHNADLIARLNRTREELQESNNRYQQLTMTFWDVVDRTVEERIKELREKK